MKSVAPVCLSSFSVALLARAQLVQRTSKSCVLLFLVVVCLLAGGCGARRNENVEATIEFTKIPEAREGGPEPVTEIAGRVNGARQDEQIVLFAKSGEWWLQPFADRPFTKIETDSQWRSTTHFGTEYAAVLVEPGYRPPLRTAFLPTKGGPVRAVSVVKGLPGKTPVFKNIHFSGYDWKVRSGSSNRGGGVSFFDTANVWTDKLGALHFRIARNSGKWTCAEVNLLRSLGYGTYRFVVRDTSSLEPAAVWSMFVWDDSAPELSHREFDVEVTQWGDPHNKNAQFVVQPYYVPANVARFVTPPGPVTYSIRWQPDSLLFQAMRGRGKDRAQTIAEHTFRSVIPAPGSESVRINLYIYNSSAIPPSKEAEVVVEKFEYLP